MPDNELIPVERIQSRILVLRGQRVLLDADLARLYGVPTKRLNEQVKRNGRKFPEDFVLRLTRDEAKAVLRSRSQYATLKRGQNIKYLPYAFTEHGAIQAANVLNSDTAIEMSVHVVRAFVRLRQWLGSQRVLAVKLSELERRVGSHDKQIAALIEAIRLLTVTPAKRHGREDRVPPSLTDDGWSIVMPAKVFLGYRGLEGEG
ncbi:MAG: ORF6N domain-containing protein [Elusimicrobia bacterium]|nr:ORF6N domain-containing protein [Elusimicrobiota bacterium]